MLQKKVQLQLMQVMYSSHLLYHTLSKLPLGVFLIFAICLAPFDY
uniref:Uncharacterized protein n=1 Tax=Arundo donax TaxID=35708 RepID=A0A0A9AM77_ARUDO